MTARRRLFGDWMGKMSKAATPGSRAHSLVLSELRALRERAPQLTGVLVASADGLLIAHDLPAHIEPSGMAALSAAQLSLSCRIAATADGGGFHEVVVRGSDGHVVVYEAGWASLTVLAGPEANVGRLHLESRPVARAVAAHLAAISETPKDQAANAEQ